MFDSAIKNAILAATRNLLRPIVRILVRNGVNQAELHKICKSLYVEVCAEDFGIRGRPTNVARIALLSGIDRKEVKRLRDNTQLDNHISNTLHTHEKLTRVLSAWYQDSTYHIPSSQTPMPLPFEDEDGGPSFSQLAKQYGGDVPIKALLKELLNSQSLVETSDGKYLPLMRVYIPNSSNPDALVRASDVTSELLDAIFHNLYVVPSAKKERPRFERRVFNNHIPLEHTDAFAELVNKEGKALLERLDDWLEQHECSEQDRKFKRTVRVGLGTYFIKGKPTPLDPSEKP